MNRLIGCIAATAIGITATPAPGQAPASAACWTPKVVGAARIRELNLMLVAVTLRCKRYNATMADALDKLHVTQRKALDAADQVLRAHFNVDSGRPARLAYDSYLISVVNFYGTGKTTAESCRQFGDVIDALGHGAATADMLADYAMHMVRDPRIKGERCPPPAPAR